MIATGSSLKAEAMERAVRGRSLWADARRRLMGNRAAVASITILALIALMATVFMTVYGKEGLRELAAQNLAKAHYLASKVPLRFSGPFFNEFVTAVESPEAVNEALLEKKIIGGLAIECWYPELPNGLLLCATEMNRREDMDTLAAVLVQTGELSKVAAR